MQPSNYNPYKLSIRRNKDLIRQYNQATLPKSQPPSLRDTHAPYLPTTHRQDGLLHYPVPYDNRYEFNPREGGCGCFSGSGEEA